MTTQTATIPLIDRADQIGLTTEEYTSILKEARTREASTYIRELLARKDPAFSLALESAADCWALATLE